VAVDWSGRVLWRRECRLGRDVEPARPGAPSRAVLLVEDCDVTDLDVSAKPLVDQSLVELNGAGHEVWRWNAHEHVAEFGFSDAELNAICRRATDCPKIGGQGNWLAVSSASRLGPNRHFDRGDARFHPDNILFTARVGNFLAVVSRATGQVVYRLGPDFSGSPTGWLVGPTQAGLIPAGLMGEGNLLVFDGGGDAGYGPAGGVAAQGLGVHRRDNARVVEVDPATGKVLWEYTPQTAGHINPLDNYKFLSPDFGNAQRLANGNTLINEGANGRLFEVTDEGEVVWEYVNPHVSTDGRGLRSTAVPRAYRVPYGWAPQPSPDVAAIVAPDVTRLRVPGAAPGWSGRRVAVPGVAPTDDRVIGDPFRHRAQPSDEVSNFCIVNDGE
jgi:hypothetical protein